MRRCVGARLGPALFWEITPREVMVILEAADAREVADLKLAQQLAYSSAVLMMIGAHAPKKFPKFEKAFGDAAARTARGPDDIFAAMDGWAAATAGAANSNMMEAI